MSARTPTASGRSSGALDPHLDLMTRVARGDQGAFADLYDQLAPTVWGMVKGIVEDPIAAQQAMGDALVRVWAQARFFEPRHGSVQLWVSTIARQHATAHLRPA